MKGLFGGFLKKTSAKQVWPYFFIILAGVIIMLLGSGGNDKKQIADDVELKELLPVEEAEDDRYSDELEKKLSETLSKVQGAGMVQVILTIADSGDMELALDQTYETARTDASGGDANGSLTEKREIKHVLLTEKDGSTAPVIIKRGTPVAEGAVIVAEGGGDAEIKASLTRAAAALLNLPAHKIEVLKMSKQ